MQSRALRGYLRFFWTWMKFLDQIKIVFAASSHTPDKFQIRLAFIILLAAIDQDDSEVVIDVASPRLVFSVNKRRGQMWRLHSGCLLNAAKRSIIPSCVTDARTRPSRHLLRGHACAPRRRDPATLGFLWPGERGENAKCSRNSHREWQKNGF